VPRVIERDPHEEGDVPALLALLPHADLSLQDAMQIAFHLTLTRVWCRKGQRGQRLVEAPGDNTKVYGFGLSAALAPLTTSQQSRWCMPRKQALEASSRKSQGRAS
jgi:hypothetical protein